MTVSKTAGGGSNPSRDANNLICTGGREAQCSGLQIRKTVSSNLTLCSKYCPYGQIGKGGSLKRSVITIGSNPIRGTKVYGSVAESGLLHLS